MSNVYNSVMKTIITYDDHAQCNCDNAIKTIFQHYSFLFLLIDNLKNIVREKQGI